MGPDLKNIVTITPLVIRPKRTLGICNLINISHGYLHIYNVLVTHGNAVDLKKMLPVKSGITMF